MKPKLRFQGFHEDWKEKKLGEVSEINPKNNNLPLKFEYIDLESVKNGKILNCNLINKDQAPSRAQRIVKKNDILYQMVRPYQRNNYIELRNKDNIVASTGYALLRTNQNSLFLYQLLLTNQFTKEVLVRCTGTSYPAINSMDLKSILISLPSLQEQEKIGMFLSQLDNRIEKQEQKIALLEERKKGWIQKLFSQTIRFKDENGQDYPKWEEKKLGEILDYERADKYIVTNTDYDDSYDIPVLTANKSFILGYTNDKDNIFNKECIIFDDFTMESKYVNFDFKVKSSAIKILTSELYNIYFLSQLLKVTHFISEGHARHYISIVQNKIVSIPSLPEQKKIAEFLSKQDELIEKEEEKLSLLKKQKQGFLQQIFV